MSNTTPPSEPPAYSRRKSWWWIPTLYFSQGMPYVVVMTVAVIMYKRLGVSNTEIALYTSWLYLPWVIKPFWSPLVDVFKTNRWWIIAMQLLIGAGMAGVAFTIPMPNFLQYSLAFLWLMAFSSATHDIAADGFYMEALPSHEQAWFVGIRSTFYRVAMITGQGLLVMFAGGLETYFGLPESRVEVQSVTVERELTSFEPSAPVNLPSPATQQILAANATLEVSTRAQPKEEVNELVDRVRQWNLENRFYQSEVEAESDNDKQRAAWVLRLEDFIRSRFGPAKPVADTSDDAGEVAIHRMQLAQPITGDETLVVNFGRSSGDPSFQIIEGTRFTFTSANWDQPFFAVIQVDKRLDHESQATFSAVSGNIPLAWSLTFYLLAAFFIGICVYHMAAIPRSTASSVNESASFSQLLSEAFHLFIAFFRKKQILIVLAFLLLYRFAEAQLVKMASPFLLDEMDLGGLGLSTGQVGFVYGTIGIVMLTIGGILGGIVASMKGLKFWLWWMVIAMNLPNMVYVFLSQVQPESFLVVNLAVAVEQFGYGFGFTAYMLYMLYVARGEHQTAHYAICTGFMALGMMIPGMFSGWLQELIGYPNFFLWVMLATIPSFLVCWLIPLDEKFGKREDPDNEGPSDSAET